MGLHQLLTGNFHIYINKKNYKKKNKQYRLNSRINDDIYFIFLFRIETKNSYSCNNMVQWNKQSFVILSLISSSIPSQWGDIWQMA